MTKNNWTANDIPDQTGKIAVITGANTGLGKEAAKQLAKKNATVILAVRNIKKGDQAAIEIKQEVPNATIVVMELNLSSLASVKAFCDTYKSNYKKLHYLINNAGVMMCPFSRTEDGFEIQMGTNHLGHFALTGLLMPLLKKTTSSRIVVTSSIAHRQGNINFDDFNWEKRKYNKGKAYGDSKLANLYFAYELIQKCKDDSSVPIVTSAHPGWTMTELQRHSSLFKFLNPFFSQNVENGVLPTLRAATDEQATSGDYFGPSGFLELKGSPIIVKSNEMSHNKANAKRLWELSEKMTGVQF